MDEEGGADTQLGPVRVWTLAAGGMVGGGIYIALGVVISVAGQWAWLSFVIAGLIAVISAFSYSRLSRHYGESGGVAVTTDTGSRAEPLPSRYLFRALTYSGSRQLHAAPIAAVAKCLHNTP
ncbi:APC family permease [Novosphingobium malaysiense]|uniref:Uncharacterized protein n=1 Tax=Novosphingobium malaysiense TaxID=1348853 RepID=A0A0B1ZSE5_9SPHN|nr:APC family permease [Novosphingobium malaysiense]KHK93576.1 hypothetical protein LK12_04875 [Novosphingobium malaysiense]